MNKQNNKTEKMMPEIKNKLAVTKANFIYALFFFFLLGGLFGFFIQKSITYSAESEETVSLNLFWEVWKELEEKYPFPAENLTTEEKIFSAIQGLAKSYNDPHTVFLPPKETDEFDQDLIRGEFSGIGVEVGVKNGFLTVIAPIKEGPADKAGLRAGDLIYKINEKEASQFTISEAIDSIRGPVGTKVNITILRQDEAEPINIEIERSIIKIPNVEIVQENEKVTRISLFNFNEPAMIDFNKAINEFIRSGKNKLILDLRNNPGGILESGVEVASYFLPTGKTVMFEDFGEKNIQENQKIISSGQNILKFFPDNNLEVVVLINEGSASASEIVAGALKYHGTAKIIGEKSFGKGSVQQYIKLSDRKSALKVTVARWLTPDGASIEGQGIIPDYEVKFTKEHYLEGKDPQLEQALNYLTNGIIEQATNLE